MALLDEVYQHLVFPGTVPGLVMVVEMVVGIGGSSGGTVEWGL